MSALMEQHERYAAARARLMGALPRKAVHKVPVFVATEQQSPPPRKSPEELGWWHPPVNFLSPPSTKVILRLVAAKHGVGVDDLIGPARLRKFVAARDEAVAIVYTHCRDMSLPAVARIFRRDHTTILHCLRKLRKRFLPVYRTNPVTGKVEKSLVAVQSRRAYQEYRHSSEAVP